MPHATRNRRRLTLRTSVLAIAAVAALAACTPTTVSTTPSAPVATTPPPTAGAAKYFPATAPWNRPAADFGRSTSYADYARRFYEYSNNGPMTEAKNKGRVDLQIKDYSVPIYDAAEATQQRRIFQVPWSKQYYDGFGNLADGATIPWNPAWKPGTGNDRIMIINDNATGRTWSLWGADLGGIACWDLENLFLGMNFEWDLCMAGAWYHAESYRTRPGTYSERGMGIEKLALVTTADEVASGRIPHALEMTVANTMFGGPTCNPGDPGAGTTCGFAVAPATKVEWPNGPTTECAYSTLPDRDAARATTVPHGMRFALSISDTEIESWLDRRGYTGARRATARTFAVALRDYGWIIAETSCWGAAIETDGVMNPKSAATWKSLGIDEGADSLGLLHGLFTPTNIYVVNPPR